MKIETTDDAIRAGQREFTISVTTEVKVNAPSFDRAMAEVRQIVGNRARLELADIGPQRLYAGSKKDCQHRWTDVNWPFHSIVKRACWICGAQEA